MSGLSSPVFSLPECMSGIIIPGSGIIIPDMQQEAIRSDSKRFEAKMAASVSIFGC